MSEGKARHNGSGRYVVKSATRAQIKAARMLMDREARGLANPSDKARVVAEAEPTDS